MANHVDVFLGGTCNGSKWREELIRKLDDSGVTYFDPVITGRDWTEEDERNEILHKARCKYMLYVITPKMEGFYSIAEVVDSSHRRPTRTIFCALHTDEEKNFTDVQKTSLRATERLLMRNRTIVRQSLDEVANFLNARPNKVCCIS